MQCRKLSVGHEKMLDELRWLTKILTKDLWNKDLDFYLWGEKRAKYLESQIYIGPTKQQPLQTKIKITKVAGKKVGKKKLAANTSHRFRFIDKTVMQVSFH